MLLELVVFGYLEVGEEEKGGKGATSRMPRWSWWAMMSTELLVGGGPR